MPTIHAEGGYAFRFRSVDRDEPPHVHVEGHGGEAKFWLPNSGHVTSRGYNRRQLRRLAKIVEAHSDQFLERWHEFFG
ncbi:MAG: DUF4160 domain-containing protein [Candidatus Limnocylindria bacterium]